MPNANLPHSVHPGQTMYAVVAECHEINDYRAMFRYEPDAEKEADRLNKQGYNRYAVVAVWVTERYQEGNQ